MSNRIYLTPEGYPYIKDPTGIPQMVRGTAQVLEKGEDLKNLPFIADALSICVSSFELIAQQEMPNPIGERYVTEITTKFIKIKALAEETLRRIREEAT
jgi:hypothetical protein